MTSTPSFERDKRFMEEALALARKGKGRVEPNPPVGALVVKEGRVVGRGNHSRYGGPHAEVSALRKAGKRARGATLYVTLEPCAAWGKTPPCTDAILSAGITEVVIASTDPDPANRGKGPLQLRAAGVRVTEGVLRREGEDLILPFTRFIRGDLPFVVAKWAMSLDGRIATRRGDSFWISGEKSRRKVHLERSRSEAVLTGIGTVLADDPLLTCRFGSKRNPLRVVVDSQLRIPPRSRLVLTAGEVPTLIATFREGKKSPKALVLEKRGCRILHFPRGRGGIDLPSLLRHLRKEGVRRLFVEAGSRVLGTLFSLGIVDKILVFIGPKIIGGEHAPGPVGGNGIAHLSEALKMDVLGSSRMASDLFVEACLKNRKGYL